MIATGLRKTFNKPLLEGMICLLVLLLTTSAQAVVLDWSSYSPTWSVSGGTYTTSIDFDASNPGNDVTITISGDTGNFLSGYPFYSPGVNSTITGGEGYSEESLLLAFNWDSKYDQVTVTFDFNYADGLENLDFSLFDIDRNTAGDNSGFRDYISNITGSYDGGANIIPDLTVEDSNYTEIRNNGKSNESLRGKDGATDSANSGNAYISFGTNVIDQVSFTYGNYTSGKGSAPNNPGQQGIGIYDFSFDKHKSKVPEVGPGFASALLCILIVLVTKWRNHGNTGSSLPSPA